MKSYTANNKNRSTVLNYKKKCTTKIKYMQFHMACNIN